MSNNPIGILDSGVGGLTIYKSLVTHQPKESFIYLADSINCPYGHKSVREIYSLSTQLVRYLIEKDCKLIVIACNTICVVCLDKLRAVFPKIPLVGTVPV